MKKRCAWLLALLMCFTAGACGKTEASSSNGGDSQYSEESGDSSSSGGEKDSADSSSVDNEDSSDSSSDSDGSSSSSGDNEGDTIAPVSIYFPQLGNRTSGDCTLIKVGNVEVLIDAGSTTGSAKTIVPFVRQYCTDGVLEYVIATHMHEDHIAAFVGGSSAKGVFESFECKTIIDPPLTTVTSQLYQNYKSLRDAEVAQGAKHYTALECWKNQNGAQRSYSLGEGVELQILYQKYYETKSSSNENNHSVCTLITQGDNNYLFTGDLESAGEASLVEKNNLPKCKLFKAGHHGSNTSNTKTLIDVIQPETVVATCCCGDSYKFPHQEFINNIAVYTDKLYIPSYFGSSTFVNLNGNITVSSVDGKTVSVNCSNNNTLFKDTDWFKKNRTMPQSWS